MGIFKIFSGLFGKHKKKKKKTITPVRTVWEIGPTIDGRNYSTGSVNGNVITVSDVHYITRSTGPLSNQISITFHLSAPLIGTGCEGPATASLYFQRSGDDWDTDGARWWATFATVTLDHAGDYTIVAPLDGPWTSVEKKTTINAPSDFADAKAHAARVGMTLGNCTGYGHGGTGPAQITILEFAAS
jgi:hypothetical protein